MNTRPRIDIDVNSISRLRTIEFVFGSVRTTASVSVIDIVTFDKDRRLLRTLAVGPRCYNGVTDQPDVIDALIYRRVRIWVNDLMWTQAHGCT